MRFPWTKKPSEKEIVEFVEAALLKIARFVDRHDVLVPELSVKAYGVEVGLSVKRVPRAQPERS